MKGNGSGANYQSRILGGKVREIGLKHLQVILDDNYPDKDFQKQVILKISSSLLPRINEHSGEGGDPIKVKAVVEFVHADYSKGPMARQAGVSFQT